MVISGTSCTELDYSTSGLLINDLALLGITPVHVCDVGGLCEEGICAPWYTVFDPCPFGLVNCDEGGEIDCVDIETDEENCGGCGVKCGDYSWCENGLCYTEVNDVVIDD